VAILPERAALLRHPESAPQNSPMLEAGPARTALAALLLAAAGGAACRRSEGAVRPNVVLIVVDTLRADVLGCYGGGEDVSPRIDALARGGIRFARARAQAPWTVPSISSLVTSCYPSEHDQGVGRELVAGCPNVAAALARAGYATGAVADFETPLLREGFAQFEVPFGTFAERARVGRKNLAQVTFAKAGDWVAGRRGSPFFLLVHTFEVHDYFFAKGYARRAARRSRPGYRGRFLSWGLRDPSIDAGRQLVLDLASADANDMDFVRQLYLEDVRATDAAIGGLLDRIEKLGLLESTLVVLAADHGEGFDPQARRFSHGGRLHEDLLRVPLVMSWPGRLAAGVGMDPVELVDVVPSVLALTGAGKASPHGRALVAPRASWQRWLGRAAWGIAPAAPHFEGWAEECCFAVDAGGLREARRSAQQALIEPPYKLVQAPHSLELYDLETDPGERTNLAGLRADLRERLAARLQTRLAALGPTPEGSEGERLEMLRSLGYVQ
jgi:arylsulfatase A-like enzyme